jgi:hypothetical protein
MKGVILSYIILIPALSFTISNCAKGEKPEQKPQSYSTITTEVKTETKQILKDTVIFNNQKGVIHIYVCSRGCYQYVLETESNGKILKLSPNILSEAFKKDDLKVIFSGKLTDEMIDINKPSPNDVPILDFKASRILIDKIKVDN